MKAKECPRCHLPSFNYMGKGIYHCGTCGANNPKGQIQLAESLGLLEQFSKLSKNTQKQLLLKWLRIKNA